MMQFSINEKYAIINVLSQIMNADGIVHPKEEDFMDKSFKELDVKIEDLGECLSIDGAQSLQIIRMMSPDKVSYARHLFISMAEADGYVHPKELAIINEFVIE